MNCASGCWCVQHDYVEYVLSVVWCQQFKQGCVGGGMVGREEGQRETKAKWKVREAGLREFISPLSCVRGTSSEPITVVTR